MSRMRRASHASQGLNVYAMRLSLFIPKELLPWFLPRGLNLSPRELYALESRLMDGNRRSTMFAWGAWGTLSLIPLAYVAVIAGSLLLLQMVPNPQPQHVVGLSTVFVLATLLAYMVMRAAMRRAVWKALHDLGYPVCGDCGYLLRGLNEDVKRCPECGADHQRRGGLPDRGAPS
jgi:hypothetical protein